MYKYEKDIRFLANCFFISILQLISFCTESLLPAE